MNIEIANRLVKLRKDKSLSQEALANALGISRQAVSKWERAESSPDTDNLIMLAKLYGVSLDELLRTDQEKFESEEACESTEESQEQEASEYVHISFKDGIHVKEKDGDEVHVSWNGIHVKERNKKNNASEVKIDSSGVHINGKEYDGKWRDYVGQGHGYSKKEFPIFVLVFVAYIILGVQYDAWHPGWLIFGIIPVFHTFVAAIRNKNIMLFSYPVVVLMYIGYYGFVEHLWYPYWLSILSIPVYYSVFGYLSYKMKKEN